VELLLAFIIFIPACFFAFTVPGIYILNFSKADISQTEKTLFGTILGFVFFTLLSYLFLIINLPALILIFVLLLNLLARKVIFLQLGGFKTTFKLSRLQGVLITTVFTLGIIGQLAIVVPSGNVVDGNLVFWSSHGFDGTWHLALMEEINRGWPFQNPTFARERLVNYHFFSDIAPAVFDKYLPINGLDLYFRLFPPLYSLLLGSSVYLLVKKITGSTFSSFWAVFFTYFAGSWGYIITYLKNKTIGGESLFWGTQIQSSSGNPPQIISNVLILTYLYFAYLIFQKKNRILYLIAGLVMSSLAMFKIYAAVVLLIATGIVGIWQLIRDKSIYTLSLSFFGAAIASILYFPNISMSTSFLIFEPWWFIRTMLVEPSRLDWLDLEYRRQTYIYENNLKRVVYLEGIGFLIFFFGNLGMRFIGLWDLATYTIKSLKNNFYLLFILIILISLALPLLFLQKGVAGNTSQFLQYFILLFGLLAGVSMNRFISIIRPNIVKIAFAMVVIALSIPTQLGLMNELYSRGPYTKIDKNELAALSFVKNNLDGVILTPPNDPNLNLGKYIPDIWDWSDTAYVAAFSGKRTYFDAKEQADIMGYNFGKRLEIKGAIFKSPTASVVKDKIKETGVNIIYFPKVLKPKINFAEIELTKVFETSLLRKDT